METLVPFIVGAPRSGTTLLRMMLDAHPQLAIPPETNFAFLFDDASLAIATAEAFGRTLAETPNWIDFNVDEACLTKAISAADKFDTANGLRTFYQLYAGRFRKSRWGDKTPEYGLYIDAIARQLPEARFVHIIRDGRDVAVSLRDLWFSPSRDYGELAKFWATRVRTIQHSGRQRSDYLEVRFEALLADPPLILQEICAFIELDFDDSMARYYEGSGIRLQEHEGRFNTDGSALLTKAQRLAQQELVQFPPDTSRIGAWREAMDAQDVENFHKEAGELLTHLGYR